MATPKKFDDVLDGIGNTPLVKINKLGVAAGLKCQLYAKLEFFNSGGSVKDRIAKRMVIEAEKDGRIKPGDTLIEPTSGNTGIGLALVSAVKGYKCIIVMPEKMSQEKISVLKALGAEVVRTRTSAAFDDPDSHMAIAAKLQKEIPNAHILDQYINNFNPDAHYDGTGEEILKACNGKVDMLVAGTGTGGTITGIAKKLKENCPDIKIIGVDPLGSILAGPGHSNEGVTGYEVEGIGYDFFPQIFETDVIDKWYKSADKPSLLMARQIISEEGILCGGSSGSAMVAALDAAKCLDEDQVCVVVLSDGIRNYLSKFVNDDWMMEKGIMDYNLEMEHKPWWWEKKVSELKVERPVSVSPKVNCKEAIDIMRKTGFDQVPVVDDDLFVHGMITINHIMSCLATAKVTCTSSVVKTTDPDYLKINLDETLGLLSKKLERRPFVCVMESCGEKSKDVIVGILSHIDLVTYITRNTRVDVA